MRAPNDLPSTPVQGTQDSNKPPGLDILQRHDGAPDLMRDIINVHLPTVFQITMRLSGRREDAEDLSQDVFLKVFENIHKLRSGEQLAGWIYTIARNHVCKEIKKRQRQRLAIVSHKIQHELSALNLDQSGPEVSYLAKEEQEEMTQALNCLDPIYRQILTLSDIEQMSYEEVATVLGIPIGTVRSRLFRARKALSEALAKPSSKSSQSGGCQ